MACVPVLYDQTVEPPRLGVIEPMRVDPLGRLDPVHADAVAGSPVLIRVEVALPLTLEIRVRVKRPRHRRPFARVGSDAL